MKIKKRMTKRESRAFTLLTLIILTVVIVSFGTGIATPLKGQGGAKLVEWDVSPIEMSFITKAVVGTAGNDASQLCQMAVVSCIYNQKRETGKSVSEIVQGKGFVLSDETPTPETQEAIELGISGLIIDTAILYPHGHHNPYMDTTGMKFVATYGNIMFFK